MFALLRFCLGGLFLLSGAEKLLAPYQNFLYVLQAYQILPSSAEHFVALAFPWIELLVGVFLVLGLWTKHALMGALLLLAGFITVVGQALLRHLPLESCGCFGEWLHVPPSVIIVVDSALLLLTAFCLRHLPKTKIGSLDKVLDT